MNNTMTAKDWTAEELLKYGYSLAHRKGYKADSIDDAAQAFALGAWQAQQELDLENNKGTGRGFVTRGGLNAMKAYVRESVKASRFGKKSIQDVDGNAVAEVEFRLFSGDYNTEDGAAGSMSMWETVADPRAVDPSAPVVLADSMDKARAALQTLTTAEREIMMARADGLTLQAIADNRGVSRQAVAKIESKAKEKLLHRAA